MEKEATLASLGNPIPARKKRRGSEGNGAPSTAAQDDLAILRAIVEGTASSTGEEFFKDLVFPSLPT
jgi:hypothetical protein